MDSFELNKILGAVLGTCLFLLTLNIASGAIFTPAKPAKPGYDIAVQETAPADAAKGPAEPEKPIAVALATANVEKGAASAKKCASCHTFEKGGPNRVGPNLYNVMTRGHAALDGFNYSAAMKGLAGHQWSYDELDKFLTNPKAMVKGTNMSFAGIARQSERADVIVYLRTLNDSPPALPQAAEGTK
jgi:cytochrome c